jgi:hypothetical protein|tara:strand:- start:4337 stop:4567 length:231 start_codon:yes stop_codon:yes gene_type:complete
MTLFVLSVVQTAKFHSSLAARKRVESQFYAAIVSQLSAGNLPRISKKPDPMGSVFLLCILFVTFQMKSNQKSLPLM